MKKTKKSKKLIVPMVGSLMMTVVLIAVPVSADSTVEMASRLAALRADVDELSATIQTRKEELRGRIRSYATQKAELETELQRAQMNLAQLKEAKASRIEKLDEDTNRDSILTPAVLEAIGVVKSQVESGMPFKTEERLSDLNRLIRQIDEKLLHPIDAFSRLWDRAEDELRLSSESGLYTQVIELDRKEVLVDVVRIGMVMMYFKTKDGRFGKSEQTESGWSFVTVANKESKEQIWTLFDSFKKQIRVGFFTLPDALPTR